MTDLFRYSAGKTDTSIAARGAINAAALREQSLDAIRSAGEIGLTADETADRLRVDRLSIRPRCTELKVCGFIRDSGQRRLNASGKRAIVWITA